LYCVDKKLLTTVNIQMSLYILYQHLNPISLLR